MATILAYSTAVCEPVFNVDCNQQTSDVVGGPRKNGRHGISGLWKEKNKVSWPEWSSAHF